MARPKKNTVDYFPHPVADDPCVPVMEQLYRERGYLCYYKLRQLLGRTEHHCLDFSVTGKLLSFSASVFSTPEEVMKMIDTLAELDVIDRDFWHQKRGIWCQEFVDSVSGLYIKRGAVIPRNPLKKGFNDILPCISDSETAVSVPEIPHSIVEYSIVNSNKNISDSETTVSVPETVSEGIKKKVEEMLTHPGTWKTTTQMLTHLTDEELPIHLRRFITTIWNQKQKINQTIEKLWGFFQNWCKYNPYVKPTGEQKSAVKSSYMNKYKKFLNK